MSDDSPLLRLIDVSKRYVSADQTVQILDHVELSMRSQDAIAVTGPSGSGKSTLLYIIGLLEQPSDGEVWLRDQQLWALPPAEQAGVRNRSIGFVFQDHHLLPQCTVLENVLLPTLAGTTVSDPRTRALELLERVGLQHRLDHLPSRISGGERQRVAVCRALINQPEVLLADEPTGNLDQDTARSVGGLLLDVASEFNAALLCVTHSLELAASFPRQLSLSGGKLVPAGVAAADRQSS